MCFVAQQKQNLEFSFILSNTTNTDTHVDWKNHVILKDSEKKKTFLFSKANQYVK